MAHPAETRVAVPPAASVHSPKLPNHAPNAPLPGTVAAAPAPGLGVSPLAVSILTIRQVNLHSVPGYCAPAMLRMC
jgi:hypothetical protein